MKKPRQSKLQALADAFMVDQATTEATEYLTRGRRFEELSDDEVKEQWVLLFKRTAALFVTRRQGGAQLLDLSDAAAEIGLRQMELPAHRVVDEAKQLATELSKLRDQPSPELDQSIEDFLRQYKKPKN